jgi:dinuclear metal center YbgI/SA1388 family protein
MAQLNELAAYLDGYLRIREETADAPDALNGLQLSNGGDVTRIAAAVDLCEATVRMAAEQHADLLLVHHGIFWGGLRPLVGPTYARLAGLVHNNIALYSAHLPLDRHPEVGNNVLLARMLGLELRGDFGEYHGAAIGVWGEYGKLRDDLTASLKRTLGVTPRVLAFGPERVRRVGVVTGAGGSLIAQAAAAGLDTFVTGEGKHASFFDAEELAINVYYAGHYATETVGVKALAEHLSTKYHVPWVFLDHPTGL